MFQCDSRLPPSPTVPFACELRFFLFNLQSTGSDHVGKFPIRTGPSTSPFPKRASDHPYFLFSKSFNRNTYGFPRKCCKQKTYGATKLFRCNTSLTRNTGGGCSDSGAHHSLLNSNPFLSHSYALFCAAKKSTHLFSSDSALSTAKHRDGGTHIPGAFVSPLAGVCELEDPGPAGTG